MKNIFLTLSLAIFVGLPALGQSKKELRAQVVSLQAQIREMQATNDALAFENKTLRKRIEMIRNYVVEATENLPTATAYENVSGAMAASTSTSTSTSASYSGGRKSSTTSSSSSYSGSAGRVIYTGPRGGRYYINSKGNKVYLKR